LIYIFKYIEYSDPGLIERPERTIEAGSRVAVGRLQVSQAPAPHDRVAVATASSTSCVEATASIS